MNLSNVAASVRQRLLNRAREEGEDFQRLLVRYALERLLHRITLSDWHDQFVLKGAFAFLLWQGKLHRPTRDLDLMGYGSPEPHAVENVFRAIAGMDEGPEDGLRFAPSSVTATPIREQAEYDGIRVKLMAYLGSARIPLQVDVGFGDAITPDPESAEFPVVSGKLCKEVSVARLPLYAGRLHVSFYGCAHPAFQVIPDPTRGRKPD